MLISQIILLGLFKGSVYSLIAIGFTLIFWRCQNTQLRAWYILYVGSIFHIQLGNQFSSIPIKQSNCKLFACRFYWHGVLLFHHKETTI